ncbi:MAG TPA: NADPH-dependent F420 reductase [Blastocatellia bacterium]|nr:NADPH-dependent F420 reductase [Blastocatellia bacterium]
MNIGIIGGTGDEGRGLAVRWAMAGGRVILGSRTMERAADAANSVNNLLGEQRVTPALNRDAVRGSNLVLLTVPFDHAAATLESLREDFQEGAVLIDITVPVSFEKGRASYVEPPEGSASEHLQKLLPDGISLVAAFKTEPAHLMLDPAAELNCDTFVSSDSKEAREQVIRAIQSINGLRPVDAGPLFNCRVIERMTVLMIGLNRRYKVRSGRFKVLGLE